MARRVPNKHRRNGQGCGCLMIAALAAGAILFYGMSSTAQRAGATAAPVTNIALTRPARWNEATLNNVEPTKAALTSTYAQIPGIRSLTMVSVIPMADSGMIVDVEAQVEAGYESEFVAATLLATARQTLDVQDFGAILDDGQGAAHSYAWQPRLGWNDTALSAAATFAAAPTTAPVLRPTQAPAQGFTCPSSCDGAVAMGLSAEQAATCRGLDRDKDGVACYGD